MGVLLTRHLLALLAECSQCRFTTVEYELDGTMYESWNADVSLMHLSSGNTSASVLAPQPVHSRAAPGKACSIMSRIGTRYPVSMCCSLCKTRSSSRGSTKRVVLGVE